MSCERRKRTGHAGRPAADDDYIGRHLRAFDAFKRFAENEHKQNLEPRI